MADSKVSALTADTTVDPADLGMTIEDPSGTPVSRKATWLNILKGALLGLLTSDGDLVTRTSGAAARITRASLATDTAFSSVYGSGVLVAQTAYRPSANTSSSVTSTSISLADVDATNLAVTFTAPSSGKVNVVLEALAAPPDAAAMHWGLREGSSVVSGTQNYVAFDDAVLHRGRVTCVVTGLTPGNSYTYKWAAKVGAGTGTIYYGNDGGSGNPYGTALIQVWSAP